MNHHYPDNYHGYGHSTPSMPNIGYTGGYGEQTAMARMVHPREGYQMSPYQLVQQSGGMYSQSGFMGQQSSNPYTMANYGNYGMSGMNPSIMMGSRQGDLTRMNGGNMVSPYYSPGMPSDTHTAPRHGGALNSQPSSYSHGQANPHMQQQQPPPHMTMMPNQGHHSIPSQTIHVPTGQHSHSTGHSMPQVSPHQTTGTYGGQNSPHMMPRTHHVPQHPMRHTASQQNPQEVADNILQMASSYPSNQTVQVPLKSRPAPYHIPRSPHYSMSHGEHSHMSPTSPAASCQASPTPSSASVKSPTPVLAPIPNPIPSPGISGLRSPCNQGMSPCGTQRSPAHMGSTYSGHSQGGPPTQCGNEGLSLHHGMSPSDTLHYSPCGMAPVHSYPPFSVSNSAPRNSSAYSPSCDPNSISGSDLHQPSYASPASSSPCSSHPSLAGTTKHIMAQSTNSHPSVSFLHMDSNPLMSLQKLVLLPETQVVDPKSVVNDTCLSSHHDESPKNVNGPAERLAESSCHSVGFQGHTSSFGSYPQNNGQSLQSENRNVRTAESASSLCCSDRQGQTSSACSIDCNNDQVSDMSAGTYPKIGGGGVQPSDHESDCHIVDHDSHKVDYDSRKISFHSHKIDSGNHRVDFNRHKVNSDNHKVHNHGADFDNHKVNNGNHGVGFNNHKLDGGNHGVDFGNQGVDFGNHKVDNHNHGVDVDSHKVESGNHGVDFDNHKVDHHNHGVDFDNHKVVCKAVEQSIVDKSEEIVIERKSPLESSQQEPANHKVSQDDNTLANSAGVLDSVGFKDNNVEPFVEDKSSGISEAPNSLPAEVVDSSLSGERPEKAMDVDNHNLLYTSDKKMGRLKEDAKCLIVQCHSPSVLSEMPIVSNGLSSTACGNDDDFEQDCGNGVHTRIQNALNSLVKVKFASVKKMSPFACVTPCSIAVGADERAACERFAFRHNGFCRTLRTSNILCNGRNRSDSTGNGDSDESVENLSENSFGLSESPQDGNRKRPSKAAKHNDHKKPNLNSVSSTVKVTDGGSKRVEPVTAGSGEYGSEIVSDDDTCYYEGVDSSDIFINNCSSDESVTSGGEARHNSSSAKETADTTLEAQDSLLMPESSSEVQEVLPDETSEKADMKSMSEMDRKDSVTEAMPSSPPSKRLCRSSGQKTSKKLNTSRKSLNSSTSEEAETIIDLTSDNVPVSTASSYLKSDQASTNTVVRSVRERTRNSSRFRPSILGHRQDGKYPVVVLEKSAAATSPLAVIKHEQVDHVDRDDSSSPLRDQKVCTTAVSSRDLVVDGADNHEPEIKSENTDFVIKFNNTANDGCIKMDLEEIVEENNVESITSLESRSHKNRMHKKKKPARRKAGKNKHKVKAPEKINRDTEVRDSFKSMKFSRTLDLMESRKKRDQSSVGPFIRVVGKQSAPDSVAVFVQPVHESSKALNSGRHKHSKQKHAHSAPAATTIHMVTNLPTDKAAMVSSSRTISSNPWVCAFCGHQSSFGFLGDLYGPYFKESELQRVEIIAGEESKKAEPVKDQRLTDSTVTRRSKESLPPLDKRNCRKGKSLWQSRPSEPSPAPPEEVWVHEACAMWSPGVYLIDNKLYGLDEAVRDAEETVCSVCKSKGAMIGCLHKGCCMKYHFICAIDKDCFMDEDRLSLLCPKHKSKILKSAVESTRS